MKKWVHGIIAVLALAAITLTAGCSGQKSSTDSSNDKVKLTFSVWETYEAPGMKKIAKEFHKKHPNITVDVQITPWDQYWTKMEASTTGGTAPDIITMHSNESYKYMSNGALLNLNKLVKNGSIKMSNYTKGVSDLYTYKNNLYAVPKDVSTLGLWYNKKLFDEAGLKYPDSTWTWQDLLAAAKKLTNKSKGIYGIAAPNTGQDGYNSFVFQNGGYTYNKSRTKYTFNTKNVTDAIQWFADLSIKEHVSPTNAQLTENDASSYLSSGRVAMTIHGSWMANQFKNDDYISKNCDVAVLPKGKVRATQLNGLGYSVSAKTKHPKQALEFLKYLGSKEANTIQAENSTAIPAYKDLGSIWAKTFPFHAQSFVDEVSYGVMRPFSKATIKIDTLETEGLQDVFDGKKTVKQVAPSIQKKGNEILSQTK